MRVHGIAAPLRFLLFLSLKTIVLVSDRRLVSKKSWAFWLLLLLLLLPLDPALDSDAEARHSFRGRRKCQIEIQKLPQSWFLGVRGWRLPC